MKASSRRRDPKPFHRLELYRAAVQHPPAEVRFLMRAHEHYLPEGEDFRGLLREDFAGTAAVAAAWIGLDENHRAMAVEKHGPTARWAQRMAKRELGERAQDLHIVETDVLDIVSPKVDLVAALNFSTFIYHDRAVLRQYFRHVRRCLRRQGLLVIDAFGGPGAMRPGVQRREVTPDIPAGRAKPRAAGTAFTYEWEQRTYDAATARIDCRIHFTFPGRRPLRSAFAYDWRLWTLPELREVMLEAGFSAAQVWCDRPDNAGRTDGLYRPTASIPAREDWVAYVVGVRG